MSAVQDSAVEAVEVTPAMDRAGFDTCEIQPGTDGFTTGTDARRAIYRAMHRAAPASQEVANLREQRDELLEALTVADDAIREMFRYFDGGETRGSYDGRPERDQLRKAGVATRIAIAKARS